VERLGSCCCREHASRGSRATRAAEYKAGRVHRVGPHTHTHTHNPHHAASVYSPLCPSDTVPARPKRAARGAAGQATTARSTKNTAHGTRRPAPRAPPVPSLTSFLLPASCCCPLSSPAKWSLQPCRRKQKPLKTTNSATNSNQPSIEGDEASVAGWPRGSLRLRAPHLPHRPHRPELLAELREDECRSSWVELQGHARR